MEKTSAPEGHVGNGGEPFVDWAGSGTPPEQEEKPWYTSKTVIAGVVTVVASAVGMIWGIDISEATQKEFVSSIALITTAAFGLFTTYDRFKDKKPLTK